MSLNRYYFVFGSSKNSSKRSPKNILGPQLRRIWRKKTCPFETFEFTFSNDGNARSIRNFKNAKEFAKCDSNVDQLNVKNVCKTPLFVGIISKLFTADSSQRIQDLCKLIAMSVHNET